MTGYIGLVLLVGAYVLLLTQYSKLFIPVDTVASFILTIHAILIKDISFIAVNGIVTIVLAIKWFKNETI